MSPLQLAFDSMFIQLQKAVNEVVGREVSIKVDIIMAIPIEETEKYKQRLLQANKLIMNVMNEARNNSNEYFKVNKPSEQVRGQAIKKQKLLEKNIQIEMNKENNT